jgi:hypothetical protein
MCCTQTPGGLRSRPEYILRALLLQVFYSVRSERPLVEQIDYNLLFRWFVGLGMDVTIPWVWSPHRCVVPQVPARQGDRLLSRPFQFQS